MSDRGIARFVMQSSQLSCRADRLCPATMTASPEHTGRLAFLLAAGLLPRAHRLRQQSSTRADEHGCFGSRPFLRLAMETRMHHHAPRRPRRHGRPAPRPRGDRRRDGPAEHAPSRHQARGRRRDGADARLRRQHPDLADEQPAAGRRRRRAGERPAAPAAPYRRRRPAPTQATAQTVRTSSA